MAMNWRSPSPIKEATALALCLALRAQPAGVGPRRGVGSLELTEDNFYQVWDTLLEQRLLLVGEAMTPLADTEDQQRDWRLHLRACIGFITWSGHR